MTKQVDFTVDVSPENIERDVVHLAKLLVEEWKDKGDQEFEVKELKGGVTNKLYSCSNKGTEKHDVLVRIYGNQTEILIDRDIELKNIIVLHKNGFAPKFYGYFNNGFVYGFFPGRDLSPEDLASGLFTERIATKLALWHKQEFTGDKTPCCWTKLRNWMSLVPETYHDGQKTTLLKNHFTLDKLRAELDFLQKEMSTVESPIVFGHNDLLGRNIIYNDANGDINFIDYEYGAYNHRGFDIANHFLEFAGFELDYSKYPSQEQQFAFFRSYIFAFYGRQATEEELHKMYVEICKFSLVSNFFWATWALVQTHISDIDFDFLQYGIDRYKQYFKTRDAYLSMQ